MPSTLTAVAVAALLLAGCGGSGGSSTSSTATPSPQHAADPRQQVRQAWTTFFDASTPTDKRVALLQNGERFRPAIEAQSKSPLAQKSSAKVENVTMNGPSKATVVYTIELAGKPALKHQHGTAVKADGTWKVSDQSFCSLLGLQGPAPPACPGG